MPHAEANGIRMYYELHGEGEPLVLIMGTGCDHTLWALQLRDYTKEHRCLIFDHRGIGLSDAPETPYTVRLMAEDTAALMRAVGIERAHIGGLSLGSLIGQELALNEPAMVHTLALHSTYADGPRLPHLRFQMQVRRRLLEIGDRDLMALNSATWLFSASFQNAHPELVELAIARSRQRLETQPLTPVIRQYEADLLHDTADRLRRIACPTLVTVGSEDQITLPSYSRRVHELIPGSEFHLFPQGGHLALMEQADEFNRVTLDFMRRHPMA
ncbi:MAG: alpha/beta fold hydrolase [Candidatus Tectomicrobia bacterium]|nr:alpha/beta fold hydrolase [Candidatus Tectomicrobia bacterium]